MTSNLQRLRHARKAEEVCVDCGKEPVDPPYSRCQHCRHVRAVRRVLNQMVKTGEVEVIRKGGENWYQMKEGVKV